MTPQPYNDHNLPKKKGKKKKKKPKQKVLHLHFFFLLGKQKVIQCKAHTLFLFVHCFFSAEWFTRTALDEDDKRRERAIEDE